MYGTALKYSTVKVESVSEYFLDLVKLAISDDSTESIIFETINLYTVEWFVWQSDLFLSTLNPVTTKCKPKRSVSPQNILSNIC